MAKPLHRNYSGVPHICSFGALKHTYAIREDPNGQVSVDSEDGVLLNSYEELMKLADKEVTFFDKAATGYFLHNFYNGCENIFGIIARFFENDIGPQSWHRDLLKRMKLEIPGYRPRLIDEETFRILNEFRAFRHVFRHCYSFQLDWEREKAVAAKYPMAWKAFHAQVEFFLGILQEIPSEGSA